MFITACNERENSPQSVYDVRRTFNGFYHVTLCVSAVFAVTRCPSVRPSVTLVDCIHTAEDIVKFLSQPGSPITLILPHAPIPNSKGNPFSRSAKYKGVGKFCDFQQKSTSILETVRDTPMVAMEC